MSADQRGMLSKGMALLEAIAAAGGEANVSDLARAADIPISTSHRLLATLCEAGFARMDTRTRMYSLGLKMFTLSSQVSQVRDLSEVALPVMRRLTAAVGESTLLGVFGGETFVYVARVNSSQSLQLRGAVGGHGPLHSTSMGKVLLAAQPVEDRRKFTASAQLPPLTARTIVDGDRLLTELDAVDAVGYATNDEENETGVRSIAVPILEPGGVTIAALCLAAPVFRRSMEQLVADVPRIRESANEIGAQLPRGGPVTMSN